MNKIVKIPKEKKLYYLFKLEPFSTSKESLKINLNILKEIVYIEDKRNDIASNQVLGTLENTFYEKREDYLCVGTIKFEIIAIEKVSYFVNNKGESKNCLVGNFLSKQVVIPNFPMFYKVYFSNNKTENQLNFFEKKHPNLLLRDSICKDTDFLNKFTKGFLKENSNPACTFICDTNKSYLRKIKLDYTKRIHIINESYLNSPRWVSHLAFQNTVNKYHLLG